MTDRDDAVHRALERLTVPTQSPAFFDDLWEQAHVREQLAARRWRRAAVALALVAAAAMASAGVLAVSPATATPNVVDLRGQCTSEVRGGLPVFTVDGSPTSPPSGSSRASAPPSGFDIVSSLALETGEQIKLFGLSSQFSGYELDRRRCATTKARIELSRQGLPLVGTYRRGGYTGLARRCVDVARFSFRIRITTNDDGVPLRADLAVVRAKTGAPLVYVRWSPSAVVGYASARCRDDSP